MFLVPKKDGSQRPIVDIRDLNKSIVWEHFKMEGIHLVLDLLREINLRSSEAPTAERDWIVKLNLKDAGLLCSANPPGAPTLPACTMEGGNLSIRLSPLRPILSPEGVHEDHASSDSMMAEAVGLSDNHLHLSLHRRQLVWSPTSRLYFSPTPVTPIKIAS